jgi:hypothetical protein
METLALWWPWCFNRLFSLGPTIFFFPFNKCTHHTMNMMHSSTLFIEHQLYPWQGKNPHLETSMHAHTIFLIFFWTFLNWTSNILAPVIIRWHNNRNKRGGFKGEGGWWANLTLKDSRKWENWHACSYINLLGIYGGAMKMNFGLYDKFEKK